MKTCRLRWLALFVSILAPLIAVSQNDIVGQQAGSVPLGDMARKARQEKSEKARTAARTRELARQLEQQQEEDAAAPAGYKYYRSKELGYSVLVPASVNLESRDEYGDWLTNGPYLTVIIGNPFTVEVPTPKYQLEKAAVEYLGCKPEIWETKVDGRPAGIMRIESECKSGPEKLHGFVAFYIDDTDVYPLICGATTPDPAPTRKKGDYRTPLPRKISTSVDVCDGIFRSVRFQKESEFTQPAFKERPAPTASSAQQQADAGAGQSLGELARRQREKQKTTAKYVLNDDNLELNGGWPKRTQQLGKEKPYLKVRVALPFEMDLSCCKWVTRNRLSSGRDLTVFYNDWDLEKCPDINCAEDSLLNVILPRALGWQTKGRAISRSNQTSRDYEARTLDFLIRSSSGLQYGNALLFHWRNTTFLYGCSYFEADSGKAKDTCQTFVDSIQVTVPKEEDSEYNGSEEYSGYESQVEE